MLRGIDFFQLLIDKHAKRKGGAGHIIRLKLILKGQLKENSFSEVLNTNPLLQQVAKARIRTYFGVGYPYLYFCKKETHIPVAFHSKNIENQLLNLSLNSKKAPPFRVDFFYPNKNQTCLIFSLHHIFFDHIGVQALIDIFNDNRSLPLLPTAYSKKNFAQKCREFFRAIGFAFREGTRKMSSLKRPLPKERPLTANFHEVIFTPEETKVIKKNCQKHNVAYSPSSFLLGCVAHAFHHQIFSTQANHDFFWIPVPVNNRPKGAPPALLFNGLTFLFYKLKSTDFNDLSHCIATIQAQMKTQIKEKLPDAFISFVEGYKYVPLPIYYWQMQLPSWGKLSSFSFSFLGDSFPHLTAFLGHEIEDITHYPSNVVRPGLTAIFYQFKGTIRMVLGTVKGDFSKEEEADILRGIRRNLMISENELIS